MKTAKIHAKQKYLLPAIIAVVAILAGALLVSNQLAINNDRARFIAAEQQKDAIAARLITSLGDNVVSTRKQNECFNTEQGPYDNGRLWCQVATVIKLSDFVQFTRLGAGYQSAAQSLNIAAYSSGSGPTERFWSKAANDITCSLASVDKLGVDHGSVTSDPFLQNDKPAVAIACADRARAAYFPFSK